MKQIKILSFFTFILILILTGCKGDDINVPFAKYTVEENKQNIEDEGVELIGKMDGMKDLSAVYAVKDLNELPVSGGVGAIVKSFRTVNEVMAPVREINSDYMSLAKLRATEDPYIDLIGTEQGTYTWDPATQDFTFTAGTNGIIYKYPSGKSSTNNTTLTIKNLTTIVTSNDSFPGQQFPTSLDITIVQAGTELFSANLEASYNEEDLPSNVTTEIKFNEGYTFKQKFVNTDSKISWDLSYKFNNETLISAHLGSLGDYAFENIQDSPNLASSEEVDKFLNSANVWLQVGNLKMAALYDFQKHKSEMDEKYPEDGYYTSLEDNEGIAEIFNKYVKATILYAKEKKAIAKSSFYAYEYDPEYSPGNYGVSLKFVFDDGSSMDETFFSSGMEDLMDAWEQFETSMSENYGFNIDEEEVVY